MAVNPYINVPYDPSSWIGIRFCDNFTFALKKDIGDRTGDRAPNWLETGGDMGLWLVEELPKKIWKVLKEPRLVSLALTILALGAVSFAFYPATSLAVVKAGIALLPQIPFWAAKFSIYLLTCETILSYGLRAQGRFWNKPLREAFYEQQKPIIIVPPADESAPKPTVDN